MAKVLQTLKEQNTLMYLNLKALVDNRDLKIIHISINNMLANPLSKWFRPIDFNKHVLKMDILSSFNVLS